jgi:hypothetical protein
VVSSKAAFSGQALLCSWLSVKRHYAQGLQGLQSQAD